MKALIFDVFGTCVDFRSSIMRDVRALARAKGFRVNPGKFADAWRAGREAGAKKGYGEGGSSGGNDPCSPSFHASDRLDYMRGAQRRIRPMVHTRHPHQIYVVRQSQVAVSIYGKPPATR